LQRCEVRLVARIWVKAPGAAFDATSVYTSSIQSVCSYFDHHLARTDDIGAYIADSRNKFKNIRGSHSVFTQKFGTTARYPRIAELPTFGHSAKPQLPKMVNFDVSPMIVQIFRH